jgi:GrpB-like predicted nucleotidyltransferase (UPF0157 family)
MNKRLLKLVSHNPEWRNTFTYESALIKEIMGDLIVKIHHIGSTAIPGIKAKPVIDMIPEVTDITKVDNFYLKCGYNKMDFSFDQSSFADSKDMGKLL